MQEVLSERIAAFSKMMTGFSRKTSDGDPSAFSNANGKLAVLAIWILSALPVLWFVFEAVVHKRIDPRKEGFGERTVFARAKRPLRFTLASLDCLAVFVVVFIAVYGGGVDVRSVSRPVVSHDPLGEFADFSKSANLSDDCCFSSHAKLDDLRAGDAFRARWFFPAFCRWFQEAARESGSSLSPELAAKAELLGLDLSPGPPSMEPFLPGFPLDASFAESLASLRLAKTLAEIDAEEGLRFSLTIANPDEDWICALPDPSSASYGKALDDWFREAEDASVGRKFPSSLSCWKINATTDERVFLEFPQEPQVATGEETGLRKACCTCRSSFGDPIGTSLAGAAALVAVHLAVASFAAVGLKTGFDNDRSLYGKLVLLTGASFVAFVYNLLVGKSDAYGLRSSKAPEVAHVLEPCAALYFSEDSAGLIWLTLYIAVSALIKTMLFRIFALHPKNE